MLLMSPLISENNYYVELIPRSMKQGCFFFLTCFLLPLSGCTDLEDDAYRGESSTVENIHVWQDGWVSDSTICRESIIIRGGEMYVCQFSLPSDDWIVIDLDVDSTTDVVDLITMSDLNYQKYEYGQDYVYLEDWTDFSTYGSQYGKDIEFPGGDWVVLVVNNV